jgi:isoleucyl-tRNA synthetase
VDLSAVYLDLLKDRMYTFAPTSRARRSAQTAIWKIAEALIRLLAPVLSFTSEEAWEFLPPVASRESSVHLAYFPTRGDLAPTEVTTAQAEATLEDWNALFAVRNIVLLALEEARQEKKIGKALEAKVRIAAPETTLALLQKYEGSLKELMNVSQVEIESGVDLKATVLPADGLRCERCWNYRTDIGLDSRWPTVCGRCVEALQAMFPEGVAQ